MAKVLTTGPDGTPVAGVEFVTLAIPPLNYDVDFRVLEEGPGKLVMTDITSPLDQPATIRVAQQAKPNIYAGTTIDPSAYLANKRGTDTIAEAKETWSITDAGDPTFQQLAPARAAVTLSLPTSALITEELVMGLVGRAVAALFAQGEATYTTGVSALLHGVVSRD